MVNKRYESIHEAERYYTSINYLKELKMLKIGLLIKKRKDKIFRFNISRGKFQINMVLEKANICTDKNKNKVTKNLSDPNSVFLLLFKIFPTVQKKLIFISIMY